MCQSIPTEEKKSEWKCKYQYEWVNMKLQEEWVKYKYKKNEWKVKYNKTEWKDWAKK